MSKNDSGPAFPCEGAFGPFVGGVRFEQKFSGMTLRDYFAAKAMQATCLWAENDRPEVAKRAYEMADAMLAARDE